MARIDSRFRPAAAETLRFAEPSVEARPSQYIAEVAKAVTELAPLMSTGVPSAATPSASRKESATLIWSLASSVARIVATEGPAGPGL